MARDDQYAEFREFLLLHDAPGRTLALAGALAALPLMAVGVGGHFLLSGSISGWLVGGLLTNGVIGGALAAVAYRRGDIPYRRGHVTAAAALGLAVLPGALWGLSTSEQTGVFASALVLSAFFGLIIEMLWQPVFLVALRRLRGLDLDVLVHQSLREHYGDDWRRYSRQIIADVRAVRGQPRETEPTDSHPG